MSSSEPALTRRGRLSYVMLYVFRILVIFARFRTLYRLSGYEILAKLVFAAAFFKTLEEILAVHVLDDGSLHHTCQTLEDATAGTSLGRLFIDVDDWIRMRNIISLDAGSFFLALLVALVAR